jgi:hypothetical protein
VGADEGAPSSVTTADRQAPLPGGP